MHIIKIIIDSDYQYDYIKIPLIDDQVRYQLKYAVDSDIWSSKVEGTVAYEFTITEGAEIGEIFEQEMKDQLTYWKSRYLTSLLYFYNMFEKTELKGLGADIYEYSV